MEKDTGINYPDAIAMEPYIEEAGKHVEELGLPDVLEEDSWISSAEHIARMMYWAENDLAQADDGEQMIINMPFVDEALAEKRIVVWGTKTGRTVDSSVTLHSTEELEEILEHIKAMEA